MTRDEIRTYVAENPMDWPLLSDWQRARLAVLLRPDRPRRAVHDLAPRTEPKSHDRLT